MSPRQPAKLGVAALSERQRAVVEMAAIHDMEPKEIARSLGISTRQVNRHRDEACRRLSTRTWPAAVARYAVEVTSGTSD